MGAAADIIAHSNCNRIGADLIHSWGEANQTAAIDGEKRGVISVKNSVAVRIISRNGQRKRHIMANDIIADGINCRRMIDAHSRISRSGSFSGNRHYGKEVDEINK